MADLIDRQAVIDLLKKSASRDVEEVVVTEKNINLIMDMPNAYDVDAVLAELEKERHPEICGGWETMRIDRAIDIVKRGGVE